MQIRYRHVIEDRDRAGNVRVYYRRGGVKVRLREAPGSAEFSARYHELEALHEAGTLARAARTERGPAPGTLGWLFLRYKASADFAELDPETQRTRIRVAEAMLAEPVRPGAAETFADFPLPRLRLEALEVLRDRKRATPGAAGHRVRVLRGLCRWARERGHIAADPSTGLRKLRTASGGHYTWTVEEVERFEAVHGPGTRARLALHLLLYTGARRSDVVRLGRQHVRGGVIRFTAHKNRRRHPVTIEAPLLAPLARTIEECGAGDLVFLAAAGGRPFSPVGFGNWFRARCAEAGLAHCSAHGLRKAAATLAADAGATSHQLMSLFGWRSIAQAEVYTRAAERRRLATAGGALLLEGLAQRRAETPTVPPTATASRSGTNRRKK